MSVLQRDRKYNGVSFLFIRATTSTLPQAQVIGPPKRRCHPLNAGSKFRWHTSGLPLKKIPRV